MLFYKPVELRQIVSIPLFSDLVPCGFPSPAQDYIEKGIDLNELCISHPAATYFVMATGTSMVDAGIYEGTLLVVDRGLKAKHGESSLPQSTVNTRLSVFVRTPSCSSCR